jgi:hypothetical protein
MHGALDPARIISFARSANPANWGAAVIPDYEDLVSRFMALLESRKARFVVVGGIALLQHVSGRNTEDIDIILSAAELAELPELEVQERNDMFAYCRYGELRVDVLFAGHRLFQQVSEQFSVAMDYHTGRYQTATIDGLILLKLFALPSLYRRFDFDRVAIYEADVTQLLSRTDETDDFFLTLLRPHLPDSDQAEIAGVLKDIRARISRMRGRPLD